MNGTRRWCVTVRCSGSRLEQFRILRELLIIAATLDILDAAEATMDHAETLVAWPRCRRLAMLVAMTCWP